MTPRVYLWVMFSLPSGRQRQGLPKCGCQFPVALLEDVAVGAEGDRRISMAETAADRYRVIARGDGLGGAEVTQGVQMSVNFCLDGHPGRELGQYVGPERLGPYGRSREQERVRRDGETKTPGRRPGRIGWRRRASMARSSSPIFRT